MPDSVPDPARAVLISNAASGANARHGVQRVREAAARAGLRHHVIEDISALEDILQARARAGDGLIIVDAGDGTVRRVVELIRGGAWPAPEPALALLRGGTTNLIHLDVGLPGRPAPGLERLLRALDAGRWRYRERCPLRVRDAGGTRHGFFLGTHAALRAIQRTRTRLHEPVSSGRLSELLSISAMVWRLGRRRVPDDPLLAPVDLEVSRDGGASWRRVAHILLLALSLRTLVWGIRPLGRGQLAGLAELNWPDYRLAPWLWRFVRGELETLSSLALRGEFGWVLDGEAYHHDAGAGALTIDVDAPVRFLVAGG